MNLPHSNKVKIWNALCVIDGLNLEKARYQRRHSNKPLAYWNNRMQILACKDISDRQRQNPNVIGVMLLGVGRKPPSVLRRYSPMRLTCEQSGQLIPLFRLAPGADWPFQQFPLETSTPIRVSLHDPWAVSFLLLCRDSRLSHLRRSPVQSEGGLSSAQSREPSTYSQQVQR